MVPVMFERQLKTTNLCTIEMLYGVTRPKSFNDDVRYKSVVVGIIIRF